MGLSREFLDFAKEIENFWHYTIISTGDKDIKISNILLATLIIYVALKKYHKFIALISDKLISCRNKNDKELIEKLLSIFIGIIFFVTILQISNIPLDTFAFLGGALALGVGLGVQNLITNLLSSLIIIVEKPLKIGDLVSVNDSNGTVSRIGNRCITLTSSSNATVFIPSSSILQNKLTNWSKCSFLNNETKIKIPKECDIDKAIETIKEVLHAQALLPGIQDPKVLLSNVTISYYICSLQYKSELNIDLSLFKHQLGIYLIKNLGSNIIIEHLERS
jgi:small-conductance mechanosensitive channel